MGLLRTTHAHKHETINHIIKSPENVTIHEHKAVTDEAIRYMEDAHNKAIENIIAKVNVDDNIISGQVFLIDQPWNINDMKIICKFKINGKEHVVEKEINRNEVSLSDDGKIISELNERLKNISNSVMLWYALKHFSNDVYKNMTGNEFDVNFLVKKK